MSVIRKSVSQLRQTLNLIAMSIVFIGFAHAGTDNIKQVEINGVNLQYVTSGAGVPVLYVHGAISDHRVWVGFREITEKDYQYVAYNRRYFGTQDWLDKGDNFTRKQHAEDLIAFVETISNEPVFMVTHSSGGNAGTHATVMRPDLFRAVVHYEPVTLSLADEIPGFSAHKQINSPVLNLCLSILVLEHREMPLDASRKL